jgi:hypothetical protein
MLVLRTIVVFSIGNFMQSSLMLTVALYSRTKSIMSCNTLGVFDHLIVLLIDNYLVFTRIYSCVNFFSSIRK